MFSALRRRLGRPSDDDADDPFKESTSTLTKSRRPPNTAFRQQRLKAWQPILVPRVVLPLLLLVALICVPIGIGFVFATYSIEKLEINYGKCADLASSSFADVPSKYVDYHFSGGKSSTVQWKKTINETDTVCTIQFDVPGDIHGPLYLYYKLTNFYQNHRKYVESYDWKQLRGNAVPYDDVSSDCSPMRYRDDKIVYPCGLVANSMFNDSFSSLTSSSGSEYEFSAKGIAWKSDLSLYKRTKYNTSDIVPPLNWIEKYPDGYSEEDLDSLAEDERFMNWMKTAALPSFMKLYGKSSDVLAKGTYTMDIVMRYEVSIFGGTKSVIVSTSSVLGGRHFSLGICYLVVGGLSVLFMLVFLIKHVFTRKQTDHAFLEGLAGQEREVL
ncbi:hypothetical protein KL939_004510 [Ogataea angusta]|nr:hypothetical protein KL943_004713 [Ogataea angusta]KAG7855335.1 hypothetical protein KL939_004510 [Ogataea angusta]